LWALLRLGLADERCEELARRLAAWQWPDGGKNCDRSLQAQSSSFMETLIPMRALALFGSQTGAGWAAEAASRASRVFLERRLFRRRRDGGVISPDFVRLHYPCYWHYDILFGLKVLAEMGLVREGPLLPGGPGDPCLQAPALRWMACRGQVLAPTRPAGYRKLVARPPRSPGRLEMGFCPRAGPPPGAAASPWLAGDRWEDDAPIRGSPWMPWPSCGQPWRMQETWRRSTHCPHRALARFPLGGAAPSGYLQPSGGSRPRCLPSVPRTRLT